MSIFAKCKAKVLGLVAAATTLLLSSPVWAAEGDMTFEATDITSVISSITGVINVTSIMTIIGAILAAGVVFTFMWFGVRKALRAVLGAAKGGNINV